jgi:hypothetical protein
MFLARKKVNWTEAGEVQRSWKTLGGILPERLVILAAVWKKETGRLGEHCSLVGLDKGVIVVKADSSVVYNELALRSTQLLRSLNRYFPRPWLRGIRAAAGK